MIAVDGPTNIRGKILKGRRGCLSLKTKVLTYINTLLIENENILKMATSQLRPSEGLNKEGKT